MYHSEYVSWEAQGFSVSSIHLHGICMELDTDLLIGVNICLEAILLMCSYMYLQTLDLSLYSICLSLFLCVCVSVCVKCIVRTISVLLDHVLRNSFVRWHQGIYMALISYFHVISKSTLYHSRHIESLWCFLYYCIFTIHFTNIWNIDIFPNMGGHMRMRTKS